MRADTRRSKAQIMRDADEMDKRYQATIARQVDSINRLLGHQPDKDTEQTRIFRYEHELMTLNEQLALADVRQSALMDVVRRVRQHAIDTENDRLLDILGGVGDEAYLAGLPEAIG